MAFDGRAFGAEIVDVVKRYCERQVEPLQRQVVELQAKVEMLETRSLHFAGTFSRGVAYQRNALALHQGVLWLCCFDHQGLAPGEGNGAWLMITKHQPQPRSGDASTSSARPTNITPVRGGNAA